MADNNTPLNHQISPHSDEIDLFELASNLWKEKLIIIAFTLAGLIIALIYAFSATPIYQTSATALPPRVSSFITLNPVIPTILPNGESEEFLTPLTQQDVFDYFAQVANAESSKAEFQNHMKDQKLDYTGNIAINMTSDRKANLNLFTNLSIQTTSSNPKTAEATANHYLTFAGNLAKQQIIEDRQAEIANIINILKRQKSAWMRVAQDQANRDIVIDNINQKLDFYQSIQFNPERIELYQVDQVATVPSSPIKPKKKLIVIIGFLLGGMIGVGVALVRIVIRNRRGIAV